MFTSNLATRHIKQTARTKPSDDLIVDAFLAADLRALVAEEQVVERVEGVGGARVVRVESVLVFWLGLRGAFGRHEAAAAGAWAGVVCVWEWCRHGEDWAMLFYVWEGVAGLNVSPRRLLARVVREQRFNGLAHAQDANDFT